MHHYLKRFSIRLLVYLRQYKETFVYASALVSLAVTTVNVLPDLLSQQRSPLFLHIFILPAFFPFYLRAKNEKVASLLFFLPQTFLLDFLPPLSPLSDVFHSLTESSCSEFVP
jgi:hypothetical protein